MITGFFLLIIILISVFVLFFADQFVEGEKVRIEGTVYYNGVTGWGVEFTDYEVLPEGLFEVGLWYMPWETKDVKIVVTASNSNDNVGGEAWIGKMGNILDDEYFRVDLHYVKKGTYYGKIDVYEVDKGFFGLWEENSKKVASTTCEFSVV